MKIVSISDIHIKNKDDQGHVALKKFVSSDQTNEADLVIFLGDIFDVMIGHNRAYLHRYAFFFNEINTLLRKNKKVYFLNGNHDFHLHEIFSESIDKNYHHNFEYHERGVYIRSNALNLYFSHGDDEEINNKAHQRFKKFINLPISKWIARQPVLLGGVDGLAIFLSNLSRNSNKKYHINDPEILRKFRETAELLFKSHKFDIWVAGHSHCEDEFNSESGYSYFNNGFVQRTQKFFFFNGEYGQLVSLFPSMS